MIRAILGVLGGWLLMFVVVVAGFIGGAFALGVERVLKPGSYEATLLWQVIGACIGLVAALLGGYACERISRKPRTAQVMAGIVLLAGLPALFTSKPEPPPRPAETVGYQAMIESAEYGREPLSTRIANPLIGFAGILIGAYLARKGRGKPG